MAKFKRKTLCHRTLCTSITVKLGNKEQLVNSEPFPVTNLPVYLIIHEQIDVSEQF